MSTRNVASLLRTWLARGAKTAEVAAHRDTPRRRRSTANRTDDTAYYLEPCHVYI